MSKLVAVEGEAGLQVRDRYLEAVDLPKQRLWHRACLGYLPALMKSAIRSPIIMVVTLVFARMQSGMIEASTTRRPWRPWTLPYWSTTAIGSEAGPILQVPELCWPVEISRRMYSSRPSGVAASSSDGSISFSTIGSKAAC